MNEGWYRLAMLVTLLVGVWEGLLAIVFKLVGKGPSVMTAVNYLPSPWCYVAAVGVMLAPLGLLAVLDTKHKRITAAS